MTSHATHLKEHAFAFALGILLLGTPVFSLSSQTLSFSSDFYFTFCIPASLFGIFLHIFSHFWALSAPPYQVSMIFLPLFILFWVLPYPFFPAVLTFSAFPKMLEWDFTYCLPMPAFLHAGCIGFLLPLPLPTYGN